MNKTANIVGWPNGGGLSRDIKILRAALEESGWSVALNGRHEGGRKRSLAARALNRVRSTIVRAAVAAGAAVHPFEVNFHIEDIDGRCLWLARRNILIPNQEWFRERCRPFLPGIDEVWAKTQAAQRAFSNLGCKVRFLGWAGVDRKAPGAGSKALLALHVAGASPTKGTEAVLDVWSENPAWPMLRVLRRGHSYAGDRHSWRSRPQAANIRIIADRVDEQTLMAMQNESAICVCPSEAEGFGHNILEAMSVGAVVITTDAPPMNEMVTSQTGLLVAVDRSEPMSLGRRYFVNRQDLARSIRRALGMSQNERDAMGRAARARFEENNAAFRARLRHCLELISGAENPGTEYFAAAESSPTRTPVD